jgi:hypothetical protein
MNRTTGMPVPPPERRLPDARRRREELLSMIDDEVLANTVRRRWLLPLGVAGAVTATGVAAVLAFGGGAATKAAGSTYNPAASGTATAPGQALPSGLVKLYPDARVLASGQECRDLTSGGKVPQVDPGYSWNGVAADAADTYCLEVPESAAKPAAIDPDNPVITAAPLLPLPADRVAKILHSCLGADASKFHAVVAVNTSVATKRQDAVVVASDSGNGAVVCTALGDTGTRDISSQGTAYSPITEFDSGSDFNTAAQTGGEPTTYLLTDVGHYSEDVAKVTVSYGDEAKQIPAVMKDGIFYLSVSTPWDARYSHPPVGYVHAFDASGKEIYNAKTAAPKK